MFFELLPACNFVRFPTVRRTTIPTTLTMTVEQAVQKLLDSVKHGSQLDEELLNYISCILTDPDPDSSFDVLQELLSGAIPAFCNKSSEEQTALVCNLLDDVKAGAATQQPLSSPVANSLGAVVAAFKQATIQSQQQVACADITNTVTATDTSSNNDTSSGHDDATGCPDLSLLLALSPPGVSQQFLVHLLKRTFRGDIEAAADWLLEQPDVLAEQQCWEDEQRELSEQHKQEEEMRRQTKKQIVDRFDLQVVPSNTLKPKHGVDILQLPRKGEQHSKVRYRDGQVVSSKGEKFIIEKIGEEWDRGSKGKVYTKGKRGVGHR